MNGSYNIPMILRLNQILITLVRVEQQILIPAISYAVYHHLTFLKTNRFVFNPVDGAALTQGNFRDHSLRASVFGKNGKIRIACIQHAQTGGANHADGPSQTADFQGIATTWAV